VILDHSQQKLDAERMPSEADPDSDLFLSQFIPQWRLKSYYRLDTLQMTWSTFSALWYDFALRLLNGWWP
jgi:hypothetical protein